jgi:hypothetical protein
MRLDLVAPLDRLVAVGFFLMCLLRRQLTGPSVQMLLVERVVVQVAP